jgi:hypothetical protein
MQQVRSFDLTPFHTMISGLFMDVSAFAVKAAAAHVAGAARQSALAPQLVPSHCTACRSASYRAAVAGALAGPAILLTGLRARHDEAALYLLLRGLTLLVRVGNKPTAPPVVYKLLAPTRWQHGDTALMCISSWQILSCYLVEPDALPRAFVRFLDKMAGFEHWLVPLARVRCQISGAHCAGACMCLHEPPSRASMTSAPSCQIQRRGARRCAAHTLVDTPGVSCRRWRRAMRRGSRAARHSRCLTRRRSQATTASQCATCCTLRAQGRSHATRIFSRCCRASSGALSACTCRCMPPPQPPCSARPCCATLCTSPSSSHPVLRVPAPSSHSTSRSPTAVRRSMRAVPHACRAAPRAVRNTLKGRANCAATCAAAGRASAAWAACHSIFLFVECAAAARNTRFQHLAPCPSAACHGSGMLRPPRCA